MQTQLPEDRKQEILEEERRRIVEEDYRRQVRAELRPAPSPPKSPTWSSILIKSLVFTVLVSISILVLGNAWSRISASWNRPPTRHLLLGGNIVVQPSQYRHATFEVDESRMKEPVLAGSIRASGGMGNDIEVVVAEMGEYENWINGHPATLLYTSGKTTNAKLRVPIRQSGTYVVALSNSFSLVSSKTVTADVGLEY
ncbi:hypothetical protein [Paludibaculum fermentans]|uniref:hypothetical protein n=1 Tax=Paludibaculum fermentans TaxID=1473598 RepID=UPI003EBDDCD3